MRQTIYQQQIMKWTPLIDCFVCELLWSAYFEWLILFLASLRPNITIAMFYFLSGKFYRNYWPICQYTLSKICRAIMSQYLWDELIPTVQHQYEMYWCMGTIMSSEPHSHKSRMSRILRFPSNILVSEKIYCKSLRWTEKWEFLEKCNSLAMYVLGIIWIIVSANGKVRRTLNSTLKEISI